MPVSRDSYQISPAALDDIDDIFVHLEKNASSEVAERTGDRLFSAFNLLAKHPGLGHRRSDLTSLPVYFFTLPPYLIVYGRQTDPLAIVAVLHSSRDLPKLLPGDFDPTRDQVHQTGDGGVL